MGFEVEADALGTTAGLGGVAFAACIAALARDSGSGESITTVAC